jgi:hypothetical protein
MRRLAASAAIAFLAACASEAAPRTFDEPAPGPGSGRGSTGELPNESTPCTSIRCNVPSCEPGKTTVIEGDVYDPAGKTRLYNVLAYVPNEALAPITKGASCDRCGSVSGDPIATALSDSKGHFRIEGVPAGDDVPVVLQVGKWRRTIKVPHVDACTTNTIADKDARLPGKREDGDMPNLAVVSGGFDELACLLTRIGVHATEHGTSANPAAAVHVYRGVGGGDLTLGGAPLATELWKDEASLSKYDAVLLACEGWEYDEDDGTRGNKTPEAKRAMRDYLTKGGRVFATHYHYAWFQQNPEKDFRDVATWNETSSAYGHESLTIDTSFPKGVAFSEWLANIGASKTPGALEVDNPAANVASVTKGIAQRWMYGTKGVSMMSFNTPIGAAEDQQCGRAVLSDIHVSGEQGSKPVPGQCDSGELTPQELALEFLLFDLVACVQPDTLAPRAPDPR